ncbi:MAG: hypothetical protein AAGC92_11395 [Pseudomonadota bacterium]
MYGDDPRSLIDLFETATFDNVWYWIITVVAWSATCHWTLGVPYDAIVRADQKGGPPAAHVEALGQASIARMTTVIRSAGIYIAAGAGFLAACVVTLGFWTGIEMAQGVALLLVPLMLVAVLNARLALRLEAAPLSGAAFRRALTRQRFWNQVIGLASVTIAAAVAALHIVREKLVGLG